MTAEDANSALGRHHILLIFITLVVIGVSLVCFVVLTFFSDTTAGYDTDIFKQAAEQRSEIVDRELTYRQWVVTHERLWSATPPPPPQERNAIVLAVNAWRRALGGCRVLWQYERNNYFTVEEQHTRQLTGGQAPVHKLLEQMDAAAAVAASFKPSFADTRGPHFYINKRLYDEGRDPAVLRSIQGWHMAVDHAPVADLLTWCLLQHLDPSRARVVHADLPTQDLARRFSATGVDGQGNAVLAWRYWFLRSPAFAAAQQQGAPHIQEQLAWLRAHCVIPEQ